VPLIDDKDQSIEVAGTGYRAPRPAPPKGPAP
jgi:hypothetical protein